jgi:hypothetical protein
MVLIILITIIIILLIIIYNKTDDKKNKIFKKYDVYYYVNPHWYWNYWFPSLFGYRDANYFNYYRRYYHNKRHPYKNTKDDRKFKKIHAVKESRHMKINSNDKIKKINNSPNKKISRDSSRSRYSNEKLEKIRYHKGGRNKN